MDCPQQVLWECLDYGKEVSYSHSYDDATIEYLGPAHPDTDLLSMSNVRGINIEYQKNLAVDYSSRSLDASSMKDWLLEKSEQNSNHYIPTTKILLGYQILMNDALRPPARQAGVNFSRSLLSKTFGIPFSVLERMGTEMPMNSSFPQLPGSKSMNCYAVAGSIASCAWVYDADTGTTHAFILVRRGSAGISHRLPYLLEKLKYFSHFPAFLPYVLVDLEVCKWSRKMAYCERQAAENSAQVQRFLYVKDAHRVFGDAANRTDILSSARDHVPSVMEAARSNLQSVWKPPQHLDDKFKLQLELDRTALQNALSFRNQDMQELITRTDNMRKQTATTLSTIMGLMSFNQQSTTGEIAKATKEDGTSMRTLAIVAAFYLPSSAVSTVMSIPVFNWAASEDSKVINPRLWIFFAVSIPLTCITMLVFWYWVKVENTGVLLRGRRFGLHKSSADKIV